MSAPNSAERPIDNRELARLLCSVSPVLSEVHRRHVQSFATLVPHVYMGDVLAHVGRLLAQPPRMQPWQPGGELTDILETLDRGMVQGDRETRNVVSLSFVRDGEVEPFFAQLRPLFGPGLRAQVSGR